jgi:hypothetical protein
MRVFIIRPFGEKEGIDFDRVDRELVQVAIAKLNDQGLTLTGGTTGLISKQGNIREDMFRMIVASDLVIADVSIHNANAFYELGIRHALRPRHTLLLRSETEHAYPFDLQTDRYFVYDAGQPGASVDALVAALRSTLASIDRDSPVFALLPKLVPHARSELVRVPFDFREDVDRARREGARGDLRLLASEAISFEWDQEGLRLIGEAQIKLGAFGGARDTFEWLRKAAPNDVQANLKLATIYQRLGLSEPPERKEDLRARSDQALDRVLADDPAGGDRAEAYALRASNEKSRWIEDFSGRSGEDIAAAALRSSHLDAMLGLYLKAANLDLNAHYPAANALGLLRAQLALAARVPHAWAERFDDDGKAAESLKQRETLAQRLTSSLCLALEMDDLMGRREGPADAWAASSRADFIMMTAANRPQRVAAEYRRALADADRFNLEATRRNLAIYKALAVFEPGVSAAIEVIDALVASSDRAGKPPSRVVLFTGHMIDAPDRAKDKQRFPRTPQAEARARAMIREAVERELKGHEASFLGIAGAACGSDILFHEVCAELNAASAVYLLLPPEKYEVESVQQGGAAWVDRYRSLIARTTPRVLQESKDLPRWLTDKPRYGVWERNNLWMMFNALATGTRDLSLIALHNRAREADGPGGTGHLVAEAARWGFKPVELDARVLLDA